MPDTMPGTMMAMDWTLDTIAVTAGRPSRSPDAPLNPPITMASTYVAEGEVEYGRYGNPTWSAFETAVGALEGGRALAYASGLAAVAAVLDLVAPGEHVVAPRHCYNGTLAQLATLEQRGHVRVTLVDVENTNAVVGAFTEDTALVWLESPTNPMLEIADVSALARAARQAGIPVAVDNTFATPLLQRPLDLGADVVVHSATKYLSGHSDLLLGIVVTRREDLWAALEDRRRALGSVPGAFEAWLALRGLRTLHLRIERSQSSAATLAERLADHPAVAQVRYPGFGSMIAFELSAGGDAADTVCRSTRLCAYATSLGGVETTLERRRRWPGEPSTVPDGLVRLSVGIEDVEDLWRDLDQALRAA